MGIENEMSYQIIETAWNADAGEYNQWDELDLMEQIEYAARFGANRGRAEEKRESQARLHKRVQSHAALALAWLKDHRQRSVEWHETNGWHLALVFCAGIIADD